MQSFDRIDCYHERCDILHEQKYKLHHVESPLQHGTSTDEWSFVLSYSNFKIHADCWIINWPYWYAILIPTARPLRNLDFTVDMVWRKSSKTGFNPSLPELILPKEHKYIPHLIWFNITRKVQIYRENVLKTKFSWANKE